MVLLLEQKKVTMSEKLNMTDLSKYFKNKDFLKNGNDRR